MKLYITGRICFLFVFLTAVVFAEVPQLVNYQGKLTDDQGETVPDHTYQIVFTIYESETSPNGMWYSGIQDILVINGLFNYQLGSANTFPDTIFTGSSRWLGIRIVGDEEIVPRTQLTSVPYAFLSSTAGVASYANTSGYAKDADRVDGIHAADLEESAEIIAAVGQFADSVAMAPFENLFIHTSQLIAGVMSPFAAPADKSIYITGVSTGGLGSNHMFGLWVGSNRVLAIGAQSNEVGTWSSCGGAPIRVLPSQDVHGTGTINLWVTITGFQF